MSRHNRSSVYKIFHLVNDLSSKDSSEKVFLVEEELQKIKRELQGKVHVVGLVGPTHRIISYLIKQRMPPKETMTESLNQQNIPIDLSLGEKQIAALFVVEGTKSAFDQKESQEKIHIIYLCFVTNDEFYYTKPISDNSIRYMLIRFMGDLCTNINILYDEKMEYEFDRQGCPYSASKKKIAKIKVVKRTQRDIVAKDVPCDFSTLYNYDPDYAKKLSLKSTLHTKNVLYISQTLERDFKKQVQSKLKKDQPKLWELIFKKFNTDSQKILLQIGQPNTKQNIGIIKNLINVQKRLYNQMSQFGKNALELSVRMYKKNHYTKWYYSDKFLHNIYWYIIAEKLSINPENGTYYINSKDQYRTVCFNAVQDIIQEVGYDQKFNKPLEHYYDYMGLVIWQAWLQVKSKIEILVSQFFGISRELIFHKKMAEEQAINITMFELKAIGIEKIVIGDQIKILLCETSISNKIGQRIFMRNIQSIEVFELRNSQNSKLICLRMVKNSENSSSIILLTYANNQFNHLCSYKRSNILFRFHSQNQKAYIINMSEDQVVSFKIDSLERIIDEKTKSFKRNGRKIIDFGVTIFPMETIYYLDKQRNALYSIDMHTGDETIYDCSKNQIRYLTVPGVDKYEYLRTFNEDMYVALGNSKLVDIFKPNPSDGKLILKKTVPLDATFLGVSILSQNLNQYLIMFDSNKSKGIVYQNINCETMVKKQYVQKNLFKGNPVLDIFYGAKQKFGQYKNYTTINDNPKEKELRLYHCFTQKQTKEKIQTYLKQLILDGHKNLYSEYQFAKNEETQFFEAASFLSQIQTRIPVQLCTLQNSNIVPLIRGKLQNYHFFKQMTIAERSKVIEFGIVEQLLKRKPDKRVLVVSIMGAQSTGKSYLMNRLFGTRFTVSSARCTIGIWLSLVETTDVNYLLMDCQGLFAVHRDSKEQQKLIRVLTSISDYTLLNQNMSMSNRGLVQLLERIAQSVKSSAIQNVQLYKGELFIIVRDVKSSESQGIETQFYNSFQFYQKNRSKYIQQLFGGHINLFSVEHFQKKQFLNDVKSIRDHIKTNGLMRPIRTSMEILESLKVIVNQLTCDDSKNFQDEMINYRIQKSKDEILKLWRNGPSLSYQTSIRNQQFVVDQRSIQITEEQFKKQSSSCLQNLDQLFKQKIIKDNHLRTTEYAQIYKEYNLFILRFFDQRFCEVEKKIQIQFELNQKTCPEEKLKLSLSGLKNQILEHKQKLRLCMQKCSDDGCSLPCTSKFRHKYDKQSQKQTARVERDGVERALENKKLTEQQKQKQRLGIEKLENQNRVQLNKMEEIKDLLNLSMLHERQKTSINFSISESNQKIGQIKKRISQNKKKSQDFLEVVKNFKKLVENKAFSMTEKSFKSTQKIQEYLKKILVNQIEEGLQNIKYQVICQQYLKIQQEFIKKRKEVWLQIEQKNRKKNQLNKLIEENIQKQNKLTIKHKQKNSQLQNAQAEIQVKNTKRNEIIQKFHSLQQLLKNKDLQATKIKQEEQKIKQVFIKNQQQHTEFTKKLKQSIENSDKIAKKLSSSIYLNNSYRQFVLPTILELNSMKKQLDNKLSRTQSSNKELQLYQIKCKLLADKIIAQEENIEKIIDQIKAHLAKQQKKLKFIKDEKLKDMQDHISMTQEFLQRIMSLKDEINSAKDLENEKANFNNLLEETKNIFVENGYESQWDKLQYIVMLQSMKNDKKQLQQKPLNFFLDSFTKKLAKVSKLTQNETKLVIYKSLGQIKTDLENKQNESQDLLQKMDSSENQDQIVSQLQLLKKQTEELENIVKNQESIMSQFFSHVKGQIQSKLIFQDNLNDPFEEFSKNNTGFSIKVNYEEKKVQIDGQPDQSLFDISSKLIEILQSQSSKKSSFKIQEQQYKAFENSEFSQEAFNYIKKMIDSVTKGYKKQQEMSLKNFISQLLVQRFQKVLHIDGKNESEILKDVTQGILQFSFKGKNEKNKLQLEKQKNEINNFTKEVEQKINLLSNEAHELELQILQMSKKSQKLTNQARSLNKQINQLRKKNDQIENQLKQKNKAIQTITNGLQILQKEKNQYQNKKNSLQVQHENVKEKLLNLNTQYSNLKIIDVQVTKILLQSWKKEQASNSQSQAQIKSLKLKNSSYETKVGELNKKIKDLQQKIGEHKFDQVSNRIQNLLEEIQKLTGLRAKLKQIARLQQKYEILKKRYEQIQESSKSLCKCLTNHKCEELCGAGCENTMCEGGAGHKGSHLCNLPNHKCKEKCAFNQSCQNICSVAYGHSDQIQHNCNTSHICQSKCKFCEKSCSKSLFDDHLQHICQSDDGCQYKCLLCENKCASKDHSHDNQAESVRIWEQNKETGETTQVSRKFHICNKEHDCKEKCGEQGICAYQYKDQPKKWTKNGCERSYNYTQQIQVRNKCLKKIAVGKLKHEVGECSCKEEKHRCNKRCPDCGSLCHKNIGHEGKHKTEHRNQQQLLYAAQEENKEIKVGKTGEDFIFSVGDISLPTRCHSSCENKGRAHYHLIQCKGGNQCLEKKQKVGAKHSPLTYYPYHQKHYDMVLCKIYWQLHNFEPPAPKEEFDLCNFMCPYDHQGNKTPFFCTSKAWHSFSNKCKDHKFECGQIHKTTQFTGLEICFLIDATGSMSRFVQQCKTVVKQIIDAASGSKKKVSLKFSIVGYRDHEMSKSNITISLKKLCQQKKKKLQALPFKNFHNQMMTTTQFTMLIHQLQKKYEQHKGGQNLRDKFSQKQLFIFDYHFPFYFDLASTDDMGSQRKLLALLNPLGLIIKLLGISQEQDNKKLSLKQLLSNQLQQSLEDLLKQDLAQIEKKDEWKLLEISDFSDSSKTIQFLDKLEADGGGDPPEAVLDGMDAVCKVGWSKEPNIMKYIIHLFDAPPHGRIYGTDNGDRYPDGCPCQKNHETIIKNINKLNANYLIYPLTPRVNGTLEIFSQSGLKFEKKDIDKNKPEDFGLHVTELICKNIEQNQIMITRMEE